MTDLEQLYQQAHEEINQATDLKTLEHYRVLYLGKKSVLTEALKALGQLPAAERPLAGQKVNQVKEQIRQLIEDKSALLAEQQIAQQLAADAVDITMPGRRQATGSLHPITQTAQFIQDYFKQLGFTQEQGPEIEDDYHNFAALNIPLLHPARAMQDTFYFEDQKTLLRTHISPVQIRVLEQQALPLRMIALGRVYRRDFDLTHTPMFHQVEGLMVDEQVTFADLKGLLTAFLTAFFARDIAIRFRPSYFPFTEPSAEVDIGCLNCENKGCRICKQTGWLEVLGCGMVHPNVLKAVKIDSERYRGFAFGAGLDRLTMLRYQITDLRSLFDNDWRFLRQF